MKLYNQISDLAAPDPPRVRRWSSYCEIGGREAHSFPFIIKADRAAFFFAGVLHHLMAQPAFPQQDIAFIRAHLDEALMFAARYAMKIRATR